MWNGVTCTNVYRKYVLNDVYRNVYRSVMSCVVYSRRSELSCVVYRKWC